MVVFDTFDRRGAAEFPFPRDVVFRAVEEAIGQVRGMRLESRDPLAGFFTVKTGMSAFSWGENVRVSVTSCGQWAAQVEVASAAKTIAGSATTHGRNQKNVKELISATSAVLQRHGEAWAREAGVPTPGAERELGAVPSVADELAKLAGLRDQGVLSDDEFASQKARLLGGP